MAATSHDFWLHNLTAPVWKRLHMMVYVAYGLLIAHVTLGALQSETSPLLAGLLGAGLTVVTALHLAAASAERKKDAPNSDYVPACAIDDIPEKRACVVFCGGERVAVFKYDGRISAISNVCQHQNGPLGEGKIIDGCVTCPWHGYQYLPDTGASPPPFTEKVATYRTRLDGNQVLVDPKPLPPGTRVEPSVLHDAQRV
jgi:nitrite reductase/ring-hydroxylating ferredoxin subunit